MLNYQVTINANKNKIIKLNNISFFEISLLNLLPLPKIYVITFFVKKIIVKYCKHIITVIHIIVFNDNILNKNNNSKKNFKVNGRLTNKNQTIMSNSDNFGVTTIIPKCKLVFLVLNLIYIKSFKKNKKKLIRVCKIIKYKISCVFIYELKNKYNDIIDISCIVVNAISFLKSV